LRIWWVARQTASNSAVQSARLHEAQLARYLGGVLRERGEQLGLIAETHQRELVGRHRRFQKLVDSGARVGNPSLHASTAIEDQGGGIGASVTEKAVIGRSTSSSNTRNAVWFSAISGWPRRSGYRDRDLHKLDVGAQIGQR